MSNNLHLIYRVWQIIGHETVSAWCITQACCSSYLIHSTHGSDVLKLQTYCILCVMSQHLDFQSLPWQCSKVRPLTSRWQSKDMQCLIIFHKAADIHGHEQTTTSAPVNSHASCISWVTGSALIFCRFLEWPTQVSHRRFWSFYVVK